MDFKDALRKLAPTAAAILGGPFAGMAVEALGSALGIDAPTQEKMAAAFKSQQLTGDQLIAIKQAEHNLALKLEELGVKREELDAGDRASARGMQVSTGSWVPGVLAMVITIGFFGILITMVLEEIRPSEPLLVMLGSLGTAWTMMCGFYYGSSHGSRANQQALLERAAK